MRKNQIQDGRRLIGISEGRRLTAQRLQLTFEKLAQLPPDRRYLIGLGYELEDEVQIA
jgi:hypothetical protein